MERLRSALFLDFDNVFGGLLNLDREWAFTFAEKPGEWLNRFMDFSQQDGRRDLLIRRAYLNPAGSVFDRERGNVNDRIYLSRFRPNLTRAGFEVVDCPALTHAHKNAADIRIVLDVMEAVNAGTRYDEFIIASSDADFTPLLQRLRAHDRRTTIISTGPTVPAYRAIADTYVGAERLLQPAQTPVNGAALDDAPKDRLLEATMRLLKTSPRPLPLAGLGVHLREKFEDEIQQSDWFGHGSLDALIGSMEESHGIRKDQGHVWDPARHTDAPGGPPADKGKPPLPPTINQICAVTDLPQLPADAWKACFDTLANYARYNDFDLREATEWTRDQLVKAGFSVSGGDINAIVIKAYHGGVGLDATPPPSPEKIREAVVRHTVDLAQAATLSLTAGDEATLRGWLGGAADGTPAED